MALQQVGVVAIFDVRQFDRGVSSYQSGLRDATRATQQFNTQINNINVNQFQTNITNAGGSLTSLGGIAGGAALAGIAALTAGIVALSAGLVSTVGSAAEFEQSMAGIAAVSGSAIGDIEEIRQLALDLSVDPNLKVSATEAAGAIEMLAKNGVTLENIMEGVAKSVVQMSNATGEDMAQAADVATDAMAIFGIEAGEMGRVADSITGVMVNSKFGLNDFALALAQGGSVAQNAGVSLEEFSTIIAATSSSFKSGSDAGTAFKTFIQRLQAPTSAAKKELEKLGVSVFDANGNMRNMFDIFQDLNSALSETAEISSTVEIGGRTEEQEAELDRLLSMLERKQQKLRDFESGLAGVRLSEADKAQDIDQLQKEAAILVNEIAKLEAVEGELVTTTRQLTEAEKQNALVKIFGSDAIRFATAAQDINKESLEDLEKQVNKEGQAAQAAATRVQTFEGAMERLSSAVEFVKIQIGDLLLPTLTALLDKGITPLISALPAIAGVALAAFSRLGEVFGGLGAGINLGFLDRIQEAFSNFEARGLGGLFHNLGLGAEGLKFGNMLEMAIANQDYEKVVDLLVPKITGVFSNVFQQVGQKIAGLNIGFLGGIGTGLLGEFLGVETTIGDVFGRIFGVVSAFAGSDAGAIGKQVGILAGLGLSDETITNIITGIDNLKTAFSSLFQGDFSGAVQALGLQDIETQVTGTISRIGEVISAFAGSDAGAIGKQVGILAGLGLSDQSINTIISGLNNIKTAFSALFQGDFMGAAQALGLQPLIDFMPIIGEILNTTLIPAFGSLGQSVLDFGSKFGMLVPAFEGLANTISENLPGIMVLAGAIGTVLLAAVTGIIEGLAILLPMVGTGLITGFEIAVTWTESIIEVLGALGEMLMAIATGDLRGFIDAFGDAGLAVLNGFLAPLQTDLASSFANIIFNGINSGLETAMSFVEPFKKAGIEYIKAIIEGLKSQVSNLLSTMDKILNDLLDFALDTASQFVKIGVEIMDYIADSILDNIGAVQGALGDAMQAAIDAALGAIGLGSGSTKSRSATGKTSNQALFNRRSTSLQSTSPLVNSGNQITNIYNLNVNNSLPGSTIRQDFSLMQTLVG